MIRMVIADGDILHENRLIRNERRFTREIPTGFATPSESVIAYLLLYLGQAEAEEHIEPVIALSRTAELEMEKVY